jgi:hypothetical protein
MRPAQNCRRLPPENIQGGMLETSPQTGTFLIPDEAPQRTAAVIADALKQAT